MRSQLRRSDSIWKSLPWLYERQNISNKFTRKELVLLSSKIQYIFHAYQISVTKTGHVDLQQIVATCPLNVDIAVYTGRHSVNLLCLMHLNGPIWVFQKFYTSHQFIH